MHDQSAVETIGGEEYCRRADVAKRLKVSVRTVERWALGGDGPPFVVLGRIPIYPVRALDDWMKARLVTSTSAATVAKGGAA
jgi:hypothetical protein